MASPSCARCGKDFLLRSRRKGIYENFLSVFCLYPYRCQICAHRFIIFKWGVRYGKRSADQREYQRIETNFPAIVTSDQGYSEARITDISVKGCRLQTDVQLGEGEVLKLELQVPGQQSAIVVEEAIVRTLQPGSAGLQFLRFLTGDEERLGRFMLIQHVALRAAKI